MKEFDSHHSHAATRKQCAIAQPSTQLKMPGSVSTNLDKGDVNLEEYMERVAHIKCFSSLVFCRY
jgi:hypothetical protein